MLPSLPIRIHSAWIALLLSTFVGTLAAAEAHSTNRPAELELKKFQLAPGLKAELFASEPLLQNPVCFSIDARGRFYVVETHRYRGAIFDITANTPWLLDDLSFRTVNDRAAFLARTFATNFSFLTNASELIRLVEDRDGDGRAETSSIFADGFNKPESGTAAGVLAQGTNVWFASIPDLWRFTNDDLRFTNRPTGAALSNTSPLVNRKSNIVNLLSGFGVHISVSGHDVHGLIRGHDGRIYFSFGDRGVCVTNREGVVVNVPDTGGVLRCEPDGRDLEIFCTGLRNPQELAFDDLGNLWTVDNDTAGADPCRVLHLVEGGDYGWRMSYQHMRGFGPWVSEELWRGGLDGTLPPAGTVSQGPAGLAFYPGTSLTPQLAGKFIHADFPGGVWAFSVKPRGASYEIGDKEKLLWNCWPTDVDFGPDGALYVLDWVQGWAPPGKGRIYRLTANDPSPMSNAPLEIVRQTRQFLAEGMGRRTEKELLALLGHADRRVRLEAQWELAERGTNSFPALIQTARQGAGVFQRIHALWGARQILRVLPKTEGAPELASLLPLLDDASAEVRGQAALLLGEGRLFNAERPMTALLSNREPRVRLLGIEAHTARWREDATGRWPGGVNRVHYSSYQKNAGAVADRLAKVVGADPFALADRAGATISGHFPARELNRLLPSDSADGFITHAVVDFLAKTRRNTAFESHLAIEPGTAGFLALLWVNRRTTNRAVGDFFISGEPRLMLEAARAINDQPVPAAYPALAALLGDSRLRDPKWGREALSNLTPAGPFSANVRPPREQVLRRALNAHFRLGAATNAEVLARFALEASVTDALRVEALFLLGAWEVLPAKVGDLPIKPTKDPNHGSVPTVNPENWPGWFDRVVGLWRPLAPRPADAARVALAPEIRSLLSDASPEVASAAVAAAAKLRLTEAAPALLARLRDPATPRAVRQQIPAAMAEVDASRLGEVVKLALADSAPEVRAASLPYLDRLEGEEAVRILSAIVTAPLGNGAAAGRQLSLTQAALGALGRIKSPASDVALRETMQRLIEGQLPPALELDAVEAASNSTDAGVKSLLSRRAATPSKDEALAPWRATLAGGDAQRGREIFFNKAEVQCSRCHIIKGEGGNVGPVLDRIAKSRSREYLLESIVLPNKAIATGFENVLLTMKGGASYAGLVKAESETELQMDSPEDGPLKVAKTDIASRQRGLSAMPEDLKQFLTPREVRDLVEFLAGLK